MRPVELSAVSLRNGSGPVALVSAELSNANRLLTVTPSKLLKRNAAYVLELVSAGVADTAGNPLPGTTQSFAFSTGASADLTRPAVTATSPINGAITVSTTVQPTITFSEAVNPAVVLATGGTTSGIRLQVAATSVEIPVSFSFSADFRTVTVIPLAPLAANTQYALRINTAVQDLAGNAVANFVQILFTTQP
jgi:hypothetical protein